DQWEELALPGMKQQRLLIHDQVLIETELPGAARQGDRRVDAIDAVGNLLDIRAGLAVRDHRSTPMRVYRPSLPAEFTGKGTRYARWTPDGFECGRCRYTATLAIGVDPYNGSLHEHAQNQQSFPAQQLHSPLSPGDAVRSTRPKHLCGPGERAAVGLSLDHRSEGPRGRAGVAHASRQHPQLHSGAAAGPNRCRGLVPDRPPSHARRGQGWRYGRRLRVLSPARGPGTPRERGPCRPALRLSATPDH